MLGLSLSLTLIVGQTAFDWDAQVWLGVLGLLLCQASLWQLFQLGFPGPRQYLPLRATVDDFLRHVHYLNTVALALQADNSPENRAEFKSLMAKMREKVDQMAQVAGQTEAELYETAGTRPQTLVSKAAA